MWLLEPLGMFSVLKELLISQTVCLVVCKPFFKMYCPFITSKSVLEKWFEIQHFAIHFIASKHFFFEKEAFENQKFSIILKCLVVRLIEEEINTV